MRIRVYFLFIIAFIINYYQVGAEVKLAKVFSNHMVLQRNQPIHIWGSAIPGEMIFVTFGGNNFIMEALLDSTWQIKMPAMHENTNLELIVKGSQNTIVINDISIGDVWVCGGQSNMAYTLKMIGIYNESVQHTYLDQLRYIHVKNIMKPVAQKDILSDGWEKTNPETLPDMSAVAYFFGAELYRIYQVPIGLISSNWSGSPAEAWMSPPALAPFQSMLQQYKQKEISTYERKSQARTRELKLDTWITNAIASDSGSIKGSEYWKNVQEDWHLITDSLNFDQMHLGKFDGIVWYQKAIEVPTSMAGKDAQLMLGMIDDMDKTWFNGEEIGTMTSTDMVRNYTIPGRLMKSGTNVLTIRVIDHGGGGGFLSRDLKMIAGKDSIEITRHWKYKIGYNFQSNKEFIQPNWNFEAGWQPSRLYNAMIAPITKLPVKGVIWYQGEANAGRAYEYRTLFPALIQDWRNVWNQPMLPFLYVQLANFLKPDKLPAMDPWPELREAQLMTLTVPNTGMAVAIDIGDSADIHPKNKKDVGYRLARVARQVAYSESIAGMGPIYQSMKIEGNKIRIKFTQTANGLNARGKELREFAIAGPDKKFMWAKAKIDGKTVVVYHPSIQTPIAVRYAWSNNPKNANLYNSEQLPASPFRTDQWKGVTQGATKID